MELEHKDFEVLALDIVNAAEAKGIHLRLLGAVAFRIHCPVYQGLHVSMKRVLTDLDFAAYYKQEKAIDKFFIGELGFESQTASLTLVSCWAARSTTTPPTSDPISTSSSTS